jgi:hypothetical protein
LGLALSNALPLIGRFFFYVVFNAIERLDKGDGLIGFVSAKRTTY